MMEIYNIIITLLNAGLLVYLICFVSRVAKLKELEEITTTLHELRLYHIDREHIERLHRDNIMLEKINLNICKELSKHINEPGAIDMVFLKARQDAMMEVNGQFRQYKGEGYERI